MEGQGQGLQAQVTRVIKERGVPAFCGAVVRRLLRRPRILWLVVVRKAFHGSMPTCEPRIPIDIGELPSDVAVIESSLAHFPRVHVGDIRSRVDNGHRCFVARHEGRIIYAAWVALGRCYSYALDRWYELADDEAYGYGAFTVPEFRGNRVHPTVSCHILRLLQDSEYRWVYAFIEPNNRAALRMPKQLGCERVGITGLVEVAGIRWNFHRDHGAFAALKRRNYWQRS